jgi:type I restriction enzyme S subunit
MKKYEKYIDTNDIWLGQIPFNWEVSSFKYFVEIINGYAFKSDDYTDDIGVPIIRIGDISQSVDVAAAKRANPNNLNELDRFIIKRGDLLLAMTGATIGKNCMYSSDEISYVNQRVGLLRSRNSLMQSFLKYFIDTPFFREFISLKCAGSAQENISSSQISEFKICVPSINEQTQIARFLDHQTTIIDEIILRKEKQIELLKEKRQSIISEVVTKGLNPNAKMRDSGIKWLGEIPEDWLSPKLKHGCKFILDGTHGSFERVDEGYRLLSVRNIINGVFTFRDDDSLISEKDYSLISSKFKIQKDDIQLAIVGATLGKVAIVGKMEEDFVTQRSLATIRTNPSKCLARFLYYYMRSDSFQSYLWMSTNFSAQPGVYLGTIQNCNFPLPEIIEQEAIITYLDGRISKIENIEGIIFSQIEKLKEYRQSLISEAVTGKIDVREWKPKTGLN